MTVFDDIPESEYVSCSSAFFVVRDRFPVSEGHSLIISRRQDAVTYFDLSSDEKQELLQLIEQVKAQGGLFKRASALAPWPEFEEVHRS